MNSASIYSPYRFLRRARRRGRAWKMEGHYRVRRGATRGHPPAPGIRAGNDEQLPDDREVVERALDRR